MGERALSVPKTMSNTQRLTFIESYYVPDIKTESVARVILLILLTYIRVGAIILVFTDGEPRHRDIL